jgi:hypothetical protein
MTLASIGHVLPDFTRKLGLSSDLMVLERAWDHEAGSMREFARIAALDHVCLVIETDSAAVMQEISLRRRELVRKLNRHLPVPFVERITVKISQPDGR